MSKLLSQTIGIDICKKHLDAHAHPCGDTRQFSNTATGFSALLKWISQWPVDRIAYEATGIYHRAFEQALARFPLVRINPLRARRFAQATGTLAKTDKIDAAMLAKMAATIQPDIRPVRSAKLAQLGELMNARDGLVRDRSALKNREKNLTLPLLKQQAKRRIDQIAHQIKAIDASAQALISADIDLARKREIIASIKGLGVLTAAQLIATMPELGSLENKQAASLAGLAPITKQSGQWSGKAHIHAGRANVRHALYMPALVAARFNPDIKAKYSHLIGIGKPAKVAITAIMRKLIVTANALLKANRLWRESLA